MPLPAWRLPNMIRKAKINMYYGIIHSRDCQVNWRISHGNLTKKKTLPVTYSVPAKPRVPSHPRSKCVFIFASDFPISPKHWVRCVRNLCYYIAIVPMLFRTRITERLIIMKKSWPGILLCLGISLPAWYLGRWLPIIGGPVFAILIGMIVTTGLTDKKSLQPGIQFTAKKILQYAVILLGFGMNLTDILAKGIQSLPIIISTIATSLFIAFLLCKTLKMPSKISTLIGVGSSICGGSAIAAAAPVIDANDEEIAQAISVIFLFNVIAALIFPSIGSLFGLSHEGFALFAGTAINDTSSVTAAATAWDGIHGSNTLDSATIVKLTRTLAILPITLVLALIHTRQKNTAETNVSIKKIFPHFVLFFILASAVTTIFNLSTAVTGPIKELSKFFIIMAMSAIGLNTNIVKLVQTGGKPILMGFCCWLSIAIVSLVVQHNLGFW